MAWAVDAHTREPRHVGMLSRQQTGLACGCVCPACNAPLQAVNAGQPPEHFLRANVLRPHFRHDAGEQREGCLLSTATLVALRLLVESDAIDLPAPEVRRQVLGYSGQEYEHVARGGRVTGQVLQRVWIDSHTADLTLGDGRVVRIQITARHTVSAGSPDAVLTISVNDPALATLSPDEILNRLRLTGDWACWESHWQDDELADQALVAAEEAARDALDYLTRESSLQDILSGLTPQQRSETVLHWLIKNILAEATRLEAPSATSTITRTMPNGQPVSRTVALSPMQLRLSEPRLEERLGSIVPDIRFFAEHEVEPGRAHIEPVTLAVEVAVTHAVDERKREWLLDAGVACLEIDARRLHSPERRLTLTQLRREVLHNPANKRWISHPALTRMERATEQDLDNIVAAAKRRADANRSARVTFDRMPPAAKLRELVRLLSRNDWELNVPEHRQDDFPMTPSEAALLISKEKQFAAAAASHFCGRGGVAHRLSIIRSAAHHGDRRAVPGHRRSANAHAHRHPSLHPSLQVIEDAYRDPGPLRRYITLLMMGLRVYGALLSEAETQRLDSVRRQVLESLNRGETTYARPIDLDAAVQALFPELASALQSDLGTLPRVLELQRQLQEAAAKERARERAAREEESTRKAREHEAARLQREISQAIEEVCRYRDWSEPGGIPMDADVAAGLAQAKRDTGAMEWFVKAWEARATGVSLYDFLVSLQPTDDAQVYRVAGLLSKGYLLVDRTASARP